MEAQGRRTGGKRKRNKQKKGTAPKRPVPDKEPQPQRAQNGKGKEKSRKKAKPAPGENVNIEVNEEGIPKAVIDIFEDFETDSRLRAAELFRWLIFPVDPEVFFEEYWEKKPLIIQRGKIHGGAGKDYYKGWFSMKDLEHMMATENVNYVEHVDVSKYEEGKKQEMVCGGKVDSDEVWKLYKEGCSVRFRHPQQFNNRLWQLCSLLQEHFGAAVGSNSYLTPAGSQGFPPHYDDVEVFLLQLEGSKHWKLYEPSEADFLARFPSKALSPEEVPEPLCTVELQQGDLMYFPRGFIHQANTGPDVHSFHLTLSTYQLNAWVDFLSTTLPGAIELAAEELPEMRQGIPRDWVQYMGTMHSDKEDDPGREAFQETVVNMMNAIMEYLPIDSGADQLAKKYLHESLPPYVPAAQREQIEKSKKAKLTDETLVRVTCGSSMRLVVEGDLVVIYHNMKNSKVFAGEKVSSSPGVQFSVEIAPALEQIITSYPEYFPIGDLPLEDKGDRIQVIKALMEEDLIQVHSDLLH